MKATLEFNLPEDQERYDTCVSAPEMQAAAVAWKAFAQDFAQRLRNDRKYVNLDKQHKTPRAYQEALEQAFYDLLSEMGLDLHD